MSSKDMRDLWVAHNGAVPDGCAVDLIRPDKGLVLSNLYLRYKEANNILSETEPTGLSGIKYDKHNNMFYVERQHKRILSSASNDWHITLNYRLKGLGHKWLRPAVPYDNTPHDVWEYICRVPAGYHTGTIEDVTSSNSQSIEIVDNPRFALFEE